MPVMIEAIPWDIAANILTVVLGVASLTYGAWRWGGRLLVWGASKVAKATSSSPDQGVPSKTVVLIHDVHQSFWHMGAVRNKPATQVNVHFHVTNITNRPVRLLRVDLVSPKRRHEHSRGHVAVRHPESNIYGSYPVRPHATVPISVSFFIAPPLKEKGEDLAVAFDVVDQFGNKHRTETVVLKYQ